MLSSIICSLVEFGILRVTLGWMLIEIVKFIRIKNCFGFTQILENLIECYESVVVTTTSTQKRFMFLVILHTVYKVNL